MVECSQQKRDMRLPDFGESLFWEVDMTSNQIIKSSWEMHNRTIEDDGMAYSDILKEIINKYVLAGARSSANEFFLREHLISLYNNGNTSFFYEIPLAGEVESTGWGDIAIQMFTDLRTVHVMAFFFFRDITQKKIRRLKRGLSRKVIV